VSEVFRCMGRDIPLGNEMTLMGIINVTPDSFSDGGFFFDHSAAIAHGMRLVQEGAAMLDVGGESTRPGADPVSVEDELKRVLPVIKELAANGARISIDTSKAKVAEAAIEAGASIINDVTALRGDPSMAKIAAESGAGLVLMHMLGEPRTMQTDPRYDDVVTDVLDFLRERAAFAEEAGVSEASICIDPGIGFGKTKGHNLRLIASATRFIDTGYPVLYGPSRKNFIGLTLDAPVDERLEGTAAVVAWLAAKGVHLVRVHDVRSMLRVARMTEAIRGND